jgi:hypothetical protein
MLRRNAFHLTRVRDEIDSLHSRCGGAVCWLRIVCGDRRDWRAGRSQADDVRTVTRSACGLATAERSGQSRDGTEN